MDIKVVSWDGHPINDGADYVTVMPNYPLFPPHELQVVERGNVLPLLAAPAPAALKFNLFISIENAASGKALMVQLAQWFNPRDAQSKQLVIEDDDGANDRYIMARCVSLTPLPQRGRLQWKAELMVDGLGDQDGRFRTAVETGDTWLITASEETNTIDNEGEDDVYPIFTIKPTTGRTAGYQKKRFIAVVWKLALLFEKYPVCITGDAGFDTASEVTGGDMQADGDDLRVFVDGVEVDRWIADINTSATKVWANLDFQAAQTFTLVGDIGSGDGVTSITVAESILAMPYAGILQINNEFFTYTAKNNTDQMFTGVRRAQKGSSADDHTGGDTITWIQHDIWLVYGNSSATAPVIASAENTPVFELGLSSNTRRYFDHFGYDGWGVDRWIDIVTEERTESGRWGTPSGENADELNVLFQVSAGVHLGYWEYYNPCGFDTVEAAGTSNVSASGDIPGTWYDIFKMYATTDDGDSQNITLNTIPGSNGTHPWDTELVSITDAGTTRLHWTVEFEMEAIYGSAVIETYMDTIDIYLDSDNTPEVTVGTEQDNYDLDVTLRNNTTGQSISLTFNMDIDEELEIDTDGKTVIYLKDMSSQIGRLVLDAGVRRDWLKLAPGENELAYIEEGAQGVTLTTQFNMRWYA